jgi:alkylation response protein AidB-like acyl-CoA dehydrogenase
MAVLTEDQTMLRDMAREWADNEAPVTAFRRMRDAKTVSGYDPELWQAQAGMGWAGIVVPEEHGGAGMGALSLGLVLEQLGRTLTATPLAASAAAAYAIVQGGTDEQKANWLPRIASGEIVATVAFDDGSVFTGRSDARVEAGRFTGTKPFVAEGDTASLFVVAASDGLYIVEAGDSVTREHRSLVDARSHAAVRFDGASADPLGAGEALVGKVADFAAAAAAAEMLGLASAAFEITNDYLKTRVQFGQTLSSFQALQHRMAKMLTELELMRSAVEGSLEAVEAGSDARQAVSLAKAVAGETAKLVSREMIQLHGGIGMTDEHDAGFYLKRSAVLEQMWGSAAWHRDRFARLAGY